MFDIKLQSEYDDLDKYKNVNGDIWYYKKDTKLFHNPYGPTYIGSNGYKEYCIDNELHRLDGPAVIWPNGEEEYWINDESLTKEEFEVHPERLKYLNKEYLICLI